MPWSRILDQTEVVAAINTNVSNASTAWVVVDRDLHEPGSMLHCLYATDDRAAAAAVERLPDGKHVVELTIPAAGFALYR